MEEQMKTNEDSKEDTENVSDFDESLKSEAAFTAKNKDLNGSQQILNDVTFEKSTSRTKETSGLKTQKNNIINSDSQPEFTSCNSELPHNSSVKGPKFPFSTRTSSHACDQDEIDRLKQIQNITTSNRLVLAKDLSPLKREDNRGSRTSEKTVSILKPVSNNSSSSDCVSECPVCRQSPQDQKHLFRKFASEDKGTKKREMIHQNTANSGMYDWNTNQGTFQNPEREAPTKRIQLNDTAVSLCGQCGFNKKGRVSKQCEEYYNSLQEGKSRQRPRVSGGCTYCQKQRNQDLHAEHKTKNISCNGCGVGNCKHLSNMNTRVNSVRSSCKNQGYNSGGSSVGFIRDIDRDIVHDSYPSSGTFQYRYPYMDSWNSKQGVEPEIHRYANDSRGTIKSENQWSFPISQCTCNHHIGHYGHRRHITFAEDLEPQEGQCSEKLNPIFQKSGVGFEPTEHIMDPEPVFLSPSRLHADYVRGVKHKKSLPEADDFLAYRKRQPDSQTQHINNPFQLSQTQDYYRHYPWPNVQNWENFLYKQRLRKRKKRAMYMGVIAIGIIVVVGIAVAMVLAVLRRKHSNVA
ncbi:uncharacterized protein LOC111083008 [Limulus polyphemus]|uniref:Uncharacterized protein LOC111083008 n=1 Tax=Limulus polyphemus TaxID=6850 RepID=A0ABM1SNS7_LIMPO|nr:uncharacterized protein LOC111083008 [Limulus polyphemus]